jgi:hypothetical protein
MRFLTHTPVVMAVATLLATLLLALSFVFISVERDTLAAHDIPVTHLPSVEVKAAGQFDASAVSEDVLWLARVIYSETKRPHEQELVAWVVRNRVETAYRGKDTYRSTVLDPWQFSAFNANAPKRTTTQPRHESSPRRRGGRPRSPSRTTSYHAPAYERPFPRQPRATSTASARWGPSDAGVGPRQDARSRSTATSTPAGSGSTPPSRKPRRS